MSPLRETAVSRPRKPLQLDPPRTWYLHTTWVCLLPFKANPMKSPTTFPSRGKVSPQIKELFSLQSLLKKF
jgi:hypothetical protein